MTIITHAELAYLVESAFIKLISDNHDQGHISAFLLHKEDMQKRSIVFTQLEAELAKAKLSHERHKKRRNALAIEIALEDINIITVETAIRLKARQSAENLAIVEEDILKYQEMVSNIYNGQKDI